MPLLTIARLSIREAANRRFASIVALATLVAIVASASFVGKLGRAVQPPSAASGLETFFTIAIAFAFYAALAIGSAFVASPSVAADVDSGIALALLPRPLSRAEYVVGKWLGLAAFVGAYAFVAGSLELAAIAFFSGYTVPHPVAALAFLAAAAIVILTFALAFGTRLPAVPSGILAVVAFGVALIDGFAGGLAHAFGQASAATVAQGIALLVPSDALWRGAVYALEPASLVLGASSAAANGAPANPFVVADPPTALFVAWSAAWVAAVLALASWSFARRDL